MIMGQLMRAAAVGAFLLTWAGASTFVYVTWWGSIHLIDPMKGEVMFLSTMLVLGIAAVIALLLGLASRTAFWVIYGR